MSNRRSHHRQHHFKTTLRQAFGFVRGPLWRVVKRVPSVFFSWWNGLTMVQRIMITVTMGILVFFSQPYIRGGLKVLGFLEPDFIKSSSGTLFETNRESRFEVFIGDTSDPSQSRLRLRVNDGDFGLLLMTPATASGQIIQSSPSGTPLTVPDFTATVTPATPGSSLAPVYKQALAEIQQSQTEYATLSARLATISAQLDNLLTQATSLSGQALSTLARVDQSLFGPYETVRERNVLGGDITYYLDQHQFVEVWNIVTQLSGSLPFRFRSANFALRVNPDQTWEIIDHDQVVMRIETKLETAKSSDQNLPAVPEARYVVNDAGYDVPIVLPDEATKPEAYPLRLVRRFIPIEQKQLWTRDERIAYILGNDLTSSTISVGPQSKYITQWKDYDVVYDASTQSVLETNGNDLATLLTDRQATGLACADKICALAEGDKLTWFNPDVIRQATPGSDLANLTQAERLGNGPAGGIAIAGDILYRTVNTNPGGTVYTRKIGETTEMPLFHTTYAFAQDIAINSAGTYFAFWADGQLHVGGKDVPLRTVPLDATPLSISIGDDLNIYMILPTEEAGRNMIVRILPSLQPEVLPGVIGNFTVVFAQSSGLVVGMGLGEEGVLATLPWSALRWIPLTNYEE